MPIAVICTGTELLKGGCCNTNLQLLGTELTKNALPPVMEFTAGDHPDELVFAISCALKIADTLIISGGLGPTSDDITLETVSRFFAVNTLIVPELKQKVETRWAQRHTGHCPKFQYKQAMTVENGTYFDNPAGIASGLYFKTEYDRLMRHIYLLPGPPAEFAAVLHEGNMLAHIISSSGDSKLHTSGFLICGTGESFVAKTVEPLLAGLPLEIAYTAVPGGTKLFLSGYDRALLDASINTLQEKFGKNALIPGCFDLPGALIAKLRERNLTIGCAESCTGGLTADLLVSCPGASEVFMGGIVSYANSVKESALDVPGEVLERHGAVSSECAAAMVLGACKKLSCRCAVSTTGIAGPGGGTPEKPVGLVYIAAAVDGLTAVKELHLRGNRRMIRERAAIAALTLLWELLEAPENNAC